MISLHPYRAMKTLFGYSTQGTEPKVIVPQGLMDLQNFVPTYDDPISGYYRDQMSFTTDRLQLYKEYDLMDADDLTVSVLDLYSEGACQRDIGTGRTIWIESEDPDTEKFGNDLLERIEVEKQIFPLTRELCKYGDSFSGLLQEQKSDGTPGKLLKLIPASPYTLSRIEDNYGRLAGYAVCPIEQIAKSLKSIVSKDIPLTEPTDPPWSFIHWRLQGKNRTDINGTSLLFASRRAFRRLRMAEDALVLYRMRKSPDRFVYSIKGLSAMSAEDRAKAIRLIRQEMRKKHMIDNDQSSVRQEVIPVGLSEDIIVDESAVAVTRLAGTAQLNQVADVDYLRKRYLGTIKVPADYLGFNDAKSSFGNTPLAYQDVNFARMLKRVQTAMMEGFATLIQFDMCWHGIDPRAEKAKFTVHMNPVSLIDERQRLELEQIRAETLDTLNRIGASLSIDSEEWQAYILRRSQIPMHLLRRSGKEISKLMKGQVTVVESIRKKAETLLESRMKTITESIQSLPEDLKQSTHTIFEGSIPIRTFLMALREDDDGQEKYDITSVNRTITLSQLFSSVNGSNAFEINQSIMTEEFPLHQKNEGKLEPISGSAISIWSTKDKQTKQVEAKSLMSAVVEKLQGRLTEQQEQEKKEQKEREERAHNNE